MRKINEDDLKELFLVSGGSGRIVLSQFWDVFNTENWWYLYGVVFKKDNGQAMINTQEEFNSRIESINKSSTLLEDFYSFGSTHVSDKIVTFAAKAAKAEAITTATTIISTAAESVRPSFIGTIFGFFQMDSPASDRFFMGVAYICHRAAKKTMGNRYMRGMGGNNIGGAWADAWRFTSGFAYSRAADMKDGIDNMWAVKSAQIATIFAKVGVLGTISAQFGLDQAVDKYNSEVVQDAASLLLPISKIKESAESEILKTIAKRNMKLCTYAINAFYFVRTVRTAYIEYGQRMPPTEEG